jgi:hypothetical protein
MTTSPIDISFSTLSALDLGAYNGASLNSLIAHVGDFTFLFDMGEMMLTVVQQEDAEPFSANEASRPCNSISAAQEFAHAFLQKPPTEAIRDGWTVVL